MNFQYSKQLGLDACATSPNYLFFKPDSHLFILPPPVASNIRQKIFFLSMTKGISGHALHRPATPIFSLVFRSHSLPGDWLPRGARWLASPWPQPRHRDTCQLWHGKCHLTSHCQPLPICSCHFSFHNILSSNILCNLFIIIYGLCKYPHPMNINVTRTDILSHLLSA